MCGSLGSEKTTLITQISYKNGIQLETQVSPPRQGLYFVAVCEINMNLDVLHLWFNESDWFSLRGGGGVVGDTHMLKHMGMCRTNGLFFHLKSIDMGPIFVKKKSLEESPISRKLQKNWKHEPVLR